MGEKRNAYRILVGKPEGKRSLGIPRYWGVDIIKMNLREVGWGAVGWTDLSQNRDRWRVLVNTEYRTRSIRNVFYHEEVYLPGLKAAKSTESQECKKKNPAENILKKKLS
jgi:hypothetical protein